MIALLTACSCALLYYVSAQNLVTANHGEVVVLPCTLPTGTSIQGMKWQKSGLENYVLFYRDDRLDPDGQHSSFENRVALLYGKMKDGDMSLVLKNATITDEGLYTCNVFNEVTKLWQVIDAFNLTVQNGHVGLKPAFLTVVCFAVLFVL